MPDGAPTRALERLLRPRAIAIVGASDKPGSLGASVLGNLERAGFAGAIHLINPGRSRIGARACLPAIEALPDGVDAAVLAIPRVAVLEAVRALAARGVGAVVIFSAGFAEAGAAGLAEQREIAACARQAGMIVEGPNCLGLVNHVDAIPLTFIETAITPYGGRAGVGIVSQSGALAAVFGTTLQSRAVGVSFSISTGNEADAGVEEFVEYLAASASTAVIALVVEQFRDPARFLAAARQARAAGKTVVLLHPGRSSAARESAATHTGAMAGDYGVMRVHVEAAGAILVDTLEELGDVAEIAWRCPKLAPGGLAVVGESGAFKALTLDFCEAAGVPLPAIDDASAPALRAALPDIAGVSNPVDMTAQGLVDPGLYRRVLEALLPDPRFGCVVLGIIQTDPATIGAKMPPILEALRAAVSAKPVIFAGLDEGAAVPQAHVQDLRALGVAYFPTPERVFRAIGRMMEHAARHPAADDPAPAHSAQLEVAGVVPEYLAKRMLAPLGVPVPDGRLATSVDEAVAAAEAIGYPVVLKAQSPALSHKSDAGGVVLRLAHAADVAQGWARLHADLARARPGLVLDGVLVERMCKPGTEMILGAHATPGWGTVLLVGFGGVQAEIWQDVRLLAPDAGEAAIRHALGRLRAAPLLAGFRGAPALDVDALVTLIARVGRLVRNAPSIGAIDLNPVIVYPEGEGVLVLDALIVGANA